MVRVNERIVVWFSNFGEHRGGWGQQKRDRDYTRYLCKDLRGLSLRRSELDLWTLFRERINIGIALHLILFRYQFISWESNDILSN